MANREKYEVTIPGANYRRVWLATSPKEAISIEVKKRRATGLQFIPSYCFEAKKVK